MTRTRWKSFSLRTLLMVVELLGAGLGLVAARFQEARRERLAVEAVRIRGSAPRAIE